MVNISVLPVAHRGKLPVVAELAVDVVILPWGKPTHHNSPDPSSRAAFFHLHSKTANLCSSTIKRIVLGWFRVIRPTVVDCVVGKLRLTEDAGGAPENKNCLFIFLSSLLVVARVLCLDLLVGEHSTPAPLRRAVL